MTENYQPKLGQLCDDSDRRDAVHIALAPVIAAHRLKMGEPVQLNKKGEAEWCDYESAIGIVDPFFRGDVMPGDRFWLMLKPGTITGLRHVWSSPHFKARLPRGSDE